MSLPDWSRAYSAALFSAVMRSKPEDFDVTEELGFEFDGEGEHDYLYVEKIGAYTEWVCRALAEFAAVPAKDVGYSGLKDRNAVTRQWFSVPRWQKPVWEHAQIEGASIVDVQRHSRKLRRGAHKSNHFKIVLRDLKNVCSQVEIEKRLQLIAAAGVPNYFGPQRFGRGGGNVELANAWSAGKRLPRHKRSIAISSARSFLFNEQLHQRVLAKTWNQLLPGDTVNLDGTGSVFEASEIDDELAKRCAEMDIHPAGILCGDGAEDTPASQGHENWRQALAKARVKVAHRSFRLRVIDLQWAVDKESIALSFKLGRGAFATSVLREIAAVE
jgi:tRNA pseudouridine13 synthase